MNSELQIKDARYSELESFYEMERELDIAKFVGQFSLERHQEEFAKDSVRYKSIYNAEQRLIGFLILILDPDGQSIELKRIVISERGNGFGGQVLSLMPKLCRSLGRRRIWLDVFDYNERARHVYERAGFTPFGTRPLGEKTLCLYDLQVGEEPNSSSA